MTFMVSMDSKWERILNHTLLASTNILKTEDIQTIMNDLKIDASVQVQVNKLLYINLLTYTKDEAHHTVKSNGSKLAFESMRYILVKGRNASISHKMTLRNRVMHPEGASKIEEIERKVTEWRNI